MNPKQTKEAEAEAAYRRQIIECDDWIAGEQVPQIIECDDWIAGEQVPQIIRRRYQIHTAIDGDQLLTPAERADIERVHE